MGILDIRTQKKPSCQLFHFSGKRSHLPNRKVKTAKRPWNSNASSTRAFYLVLTAEHFFLSKWNHTLTLTRLYFLHPPPPLPIPSHAPCHCRGTGVSTALNYLQKIYILHKIRCGGFTLFSSTTSIDRCLLPSLPNFRKSGMMPINVYPGPPPRRLLIFFF